MNRKVPLLIAVIVIIASSLLGSGLAVWQYLRFQKEQLKISEMKLPKEKKSEREEIIGLEIEKIKGELLEEWRKSNPKKDIDISQFLLSPNRKFAVVRAYFQENQEEGFFTESKFLIVNLDIKQLKEFDVDDLLAEEINSYWEEVNSLIIEEGEGMGLYSEFSLGKWSLDSKNYWGFIELTTGSDPPTSQAVSIFKIDVDDWKIERFSIPRPGKFTLIFPGNLNLEKEMILFEQIAEDGGISLYLYNLRSGEERIIISYSKEILSKYFQGGGFLAYVHQLPWVSTEEARYLSPAWIDKKTVFYFDLETRGKQIKRIEQ